MASESSSKRAQAMNDNHSFDNFKSPSENHSFDNFKSPSLTSSTRKEIPPTTSNKKFENKSENNSVPNPAEAFDDTASSLHETKYSINQNNR